MHMLTLAGTTLASWSDFGLTRVASATMTAAERRVLKFYRRTAAPEVKHGRAYGTPADVFAFALLLVELFTAQVRPQPTTRLALAVSESCADPPLHTVSLACS